MSVPFSIVKFSFSPTQTNPSRIVSHKIIQEAENFGFSDIEMFPKYYVCLINVSVNEESFS